MSKNKFIHLHVHSEYSLLDGLSNIKQMAAYVKGLGMKAVALTDHGAMYGAIEFYKLMQKEGVKPIVGIEAYTTAGDHKKREGGKGKENSHLLLLARDEEGYKNLMKLTTIAHLEGYYYRPRFTRTLLEKYSKGLVCTSACVQGEIPRLLREGKYDKARELALWFQQVFGEDFYLELQRHEYEKYVGKGETAEIRRELKENLAIEQAVNEGVVKLSRELGIALVATNDAHYIRPEEAMAQDVLVCVATGKNVSDVKRLRMVDAPTFYLRSEEEMKGLFEDYPEAITNTGKIADKCNLEISTLGKWFFPEVAMPKGKKAEEFLKEKARKALKEKFEKVTKELRERLEYELSVICKKGYAPYFLIFEDMASWAQKKRIPVNTRGSVAGSLVSYVLGITSVDPIRYMLPFERFLNPFRPSAPDIDLDIADDRREEMIFYLVEKYGKEKVAQICTFGRMLARGSVRDTARVLGYPYSVGDKISKLIPPGLQGFPMSIERALKESAELAELYKTDKDAKRVLDLARQVEGSARHVSVHAAGVVISPTNLVDYTPLQLEPGGDKVITQYEMHACEDVGLVKLDVLGIRNLSILREAVVRVREAEGVDIELGELPLDDAKTFEMLSRGETMGTFQLSGSGMTRYLVELEPERVEDIMAMIALFRPGPIANISDYIARKKGKKPVTYFHPKMEKFLDKSFGILVYQDDLLFTAMEVAGYDWEEVDKFRKAVGKKIPEEMAKQHEIFVAGCMKHSGMSKKEAGRLWKLFEPFQGYGFNKAHAASYGIVAYQTAYMKANYPVEFMAALLTAESGDTDKIAAAVAECRRMGMAILPPDINESDVGFTIEPAEKSLTGRAVRFGLSAIKNVGEAAIEAILEARKEGDFLSLTDFCGRVDNRRVNKRVFESLIKAGAMDRFGKRAAMLSGLDGIRNRTGGRKAAKGQTSLFGEGEKTTVADKLPEVEEFTTKEMLALERELLGFYLTEHPTAAELGRIAHLLTYRLGEISSEEHAGEKVMLGGVITDVRVVLTKKNNQEMAFASMADEAGKLGLVIFPSVYVEFKQLLVTGKVVVVKGRVDSREEELSLIVEELLAPEELLAKQEEEGEEVVVLELPVNLNPQVVLILSQLFKKNKGEKQVKLEFVNGKGPVREMVVPFGVDWSRQLAEEVRRLLRESSGN